jgi:hypothetical protein
LGTNFRDTIDWAADIISQNKLYAISVDTDKSKSGDGFLDQEIQMWVKVASDNVDDSKTWGGDELEDWLLGKSKRKAKEDGMDLAEQILQRSVDRGLVRDQALKYLHELVGSWDFNIFDLRGLLAKETLVLTERFSGGQPAEFKHDMADIDAEQVEMMPLLLLHCSKLHDIYALFDIPPAGLVSFSRELEKGYRSNNPFHNSIHACDVLQAACVISTWCNQIATTVTSTVLNIQDILSIFLAAVMQDFEHPGFNNSFLNRTKHPIAVRYNDKSCLENHHAAAGFLCLIHADPDPLQNVSENQYQQMRKAIIRMILATDVASHLTELTIFKTKMTAKDFPSSKTEDKQVLMNTVLHAADQNIVARAQNVALMWVPRVMEEFFRQGDLEAEMGLNVTPFYDRTQHVTAVPSCQMGFIDFMVLPLYDALGQFIPEVGQVCVPNIHIQREYFRRIQDEQKGLDPRRNMTQNKKKEKGIFGAIRKRVGGNADGSSRFSNWRNRKKVAQEP